jgi:non-heme chloroperoxidase
MATELVLETSRRIGALGKYLEVSPGIELHYWDVGSGPPLVLVPGWTFTADVFVHQIEEFSKDHRVIAIDPRCQGRSSKTATGNDYAAHSADLKVLVEALDLRDMTLVGWSSGSAETLGYIRLAGLERVKAHVDIDLPPKLLSTEESDWVEGSLADISGGIMAMTPRASLREVVRWYTENVMVQRELAPEELDWIVAQSETTPQWAAIALYTYLMFADYRPEASQLDGARPSLFVVAEHWAEVAKPYIEKNWPRAQVQVLGGHMMFWEHPEKFNAILREFIAGA